MTMGTEKGCDICARECWPWVIKMVDEEDK